MVRATSKKAVPLAIALILTLLPVFALIVGIPNALAMPSMKQAEEQSKGLQISIDVEPNITIGSEIYTYGIAKILWSLSPTNYTWINVTLKIYDSTGTAVLTHFYDSEKFTPIHYSFLAEWNTTAVSDGTYTINVTVWYLNNTQKVVTSESMTVIVANTHPPVSGVELDVANPQYPAYEYEGQKWLEGVANIIWKVSPSVAAIKSVNFTLIAPNGSKVYDKQDMTSETKVSFWILYRTPAGELGYYDGLAGMVTVDLSKYPDGMWNATVELVDYYGHEYVATLNFYVDNSLPEVKIVAPSAGEQLTGTVQIKFTIEEENPVSVNLAIDEKIYDITEFYANGTVNVFTWDTTLVVDGEHVITVTVTDKAGNVGSVSIKVVTLNAHKTAESFYNTGVLFGLGVGMPLAFLVGFVIALFIARRLARVKVE